jgi:signal transduction histidine kinase
VERERRLAAAEERARIARDLHDSAGHAINVIAVRAGAARLRHRQDPDRSLAALEAIEDVARQTAADIDQIVGALRSDEPAATEVEAPTGLASLSTLIEQHREAGVKVDVERHGRPRGLSPAIDQAAYRILQEALTNAARHGDGMAHIELRFSDEWLELTVTNRMPEPAPPPSPRGHGLIGLRERATLLGGTLDVEHRGDSFRIRAGLPYGVHPA